MSELSQEDIRQLPTITEVINVLESVQQQFCVHGGWLCKMPELRMFVQMGMENPYCAYFNDASIDKFIVNRLASGRYCLKPNLSHTPVLFRGENKRYPSITSAFNRRDKDDKLVNNLKIADFTSLVKTHPLCSMFDNGINLPSLGETLFLEINYYGLAQHYNFNTSLIDFTSNSWVASFFAVTENNGNDTYLPITDINEYPYGVVYMHKIVPQVSFQMFCTIGQQVFPRCGAQKAYAYQENISRLNINEMVYPIRFRHDAESSQKVYDILKGGKSLFPNDELSQHANAINKSNEVSFISFAQNLYSNPQDTLNGNLERCDKKGIFVNPNLNYCFTPDMLQSFFADVKNGIWEQYCASIHFPCANNVKLKDELLALPKNEYYRQYFDRRYFDRLYYHILEDKFRAEQKFHRIIKKNNYA